MIDTRIERLIPYAELLKRKLPKPPSATTMWRWRTSGHRGCVIETVPVGGLICSTEEAFQRWAEKLGGFDASEDAEAEIESAASSDRQHVAERKRRIHAADRKAEELENRLKKQKNTRPKSAAASV